MNYLEYIKDFDNLAAENERVYEFRKIYNSNIEQFIDYYYSNDSDSESHNETVNSNIDIKEEDYSEISSKYIRLRSSNGYLSPTNLTQTSLPVMSNMEYLALKNNQLSTLFKKGINEMEEIQLSNQIMQ